VLATSVFLAIVFDCCDEGVRRVIVSSVIVVEDMCTLFELSFFTVLIDCEGVLVVAIEINTRCLRFTRVRERIFAIPRSSNQTGLSYPSMSPMRLV